MSLYQQKRKITPTDSDSGSGRQLEDDEALQALGYTPAFRREFGTLATVGFAFSAFGICSSIAITFNTPLLLGGPASVTWCWLLGGVNSIILASSIAEIVSAYPTCGGLYGASAFLSPRKYRARVGWIVGWINILGLIIGNSSAELGIANMILAAASLWTNGTFEITAGKVVGLTTGLLLVHGIFNSFRTRQLAYIASFSVFVNVGGSLLIIILLLAMTPRSEMHPASYVFGADGLINGTRGWNNGISFLLGLLSVQWTMTGYDLTAHISEEIRHPASITPVAIMIATVVTVTIGWLLNIVVVLCSGPFGNLTDSSGSAFLTIMVLRLGRPISIVIWLLVCLTVWTAVQSGIQGASRCIYAFSRDHGLPDGGFFGRVNHITKTPLRTVWLTVSLQALPPLLYLVSPVAANAIFAMAAMSQNLSYIIPIIVRRIFHSHPEVKFKPGPYYMGDGWLGTFANWWCTLWTFFICILFSFPTVLPVTAANMNYAAPVTLGVPLIAGLWYVLSAHRYYHGPPIQGVARTDGARVQESNDLDGATRDSLTEGCGTVEQY